MKFLGLWNRFQHLEKVVIQIMFPLQAEKNRLSDSERKKNMVKIFNQAEDVDFSQVFRVGCDRPGDLFVKHGVSFAGFHL